MGKVIIFPIKRNICFVIFLAIWNLKINGEHNE